MRGKVVDGGNGKEEFQLALDIACIELEKEGSRIVDIKFQMGGGNDYGYHFHALIVYHKVVKVA